MSEVFELVLRALVAGCLVALISQLSTALQPKMFAGLLAAAPSVAVASLVVIALTKPGSVQPHAQGMIAGALGMVACCAVAMLLEPKARALVATGIGWVAWAVVACAAYAVVR